MDQLNSWLSGKKTNILSAWGFCGALFMVMNGYGDDQISVLLATVATLAATGRAAIKKSNGVVPFLIIGSMAGLFLFNGCASLGVVDPATGTSPAQDIVAAAGTGAALFGPVIGTAVPLGLASVLSILIALGKSKEPTPT